MARGPSAAEFSALMVGAFNTIYTALQGFLSRDFWASVFAPLALFAAIHAGIATRFGLRLDTAELLSDGSRLAKLLTLLVVALVLLGYLIQPLLPLLRGLLDGSLLPPRVAGWLLAARRPELARTADEITRAFNAQADLGDFAGELGRAEGDYRMALKAAEGLGSARNEPLTGAAERQVDILRNCLAGPAPPTLDQLSTAKAAVIAVLGANNPTMRTPKPDAELSTRVDSVSNRFFAAAKEAAKAARAEYEGVLARNRLAPALKQPSPTALGDARFVAEYYAKHVYGVGFDFLWPRLTLALRADAKGDPCNEAIEQGRARCDFAILAVALTLSVPLFWLPFMLLRGGPGWLFVIVAASTPVALHFFYRLAVEAQIALADVVKTTIDRHRFLVLRMLNQPIPASRDEERALWKRIAGAEQNHLLAYLPYVAPELPRG